MSEADEIAEVLRLAETLTASNAREVMDWFQKAVQVTVKYEKEMKPKDRRFVMMKLEAAWGPTPSQTPSLSASEADLQEMRTYIKWIMKHIMYLTHPDNDAYDAWISHAEETMNDCREILGFPLLDLPLKK